MNLLHVLHVGDFSPPDLRFPPLGYPSRLTTSFAISLPSPASALPKGTTPKLTYRTIPKTGLRPTEVGFGCMVTSDPSVIERAADVGINAFDTRGYQGGNNERIVALKGKRNSIILSSKTPAPTEEEAWKDLDTSLRALATDHLDIGICMPSASLSRSWMD